MLTTLASLDPNEHEDDDCLVSWPEKVRGSLEEALQKSSHRAVQDALQRSELPGEVKRLFVEVFALDEAVPKAAIEAAVKKLHVSLGHPSGPDLV